MYIGHVGAALGAKGIRPQVGLGVLLLATYTPDWIDAGLCLAGSPQSMLSHSVPAVALFALVATLVYGLAVRDWRSAAVVGGVVVSHMLLDFVTGNKPTWPGGPMIGLRLYSIPVADFLIEGGLIAFGVALYRRTLPSPRLWRDTTLMAGALLAMQLAIDIGHAVMRSVQKC